MKSRAAASSQGSQYCAKLAHDLIQFKATSYNCKFFLCLSTVKETVSFEQYYIYKKLNSPTFIKHWTHPDLNLYVDSKAI